MRGIEETERLSIVGGRKERCVAYAGACGWVIELVVTMREGVVDWMESMCDGKGKGGGARANRCDSC